MVLILKMIQNQSLMPRCGAVSLHSITKYRMSGPLYMAYSTVLPSNLTNNRCEGESARYTSTISLECDNRRRQPLIMDARDISFPFTVGALEENAPTCTFSRDGTNARIGYITL